MSVDGHGLDRGALHELVEQLRMKNAQLEEALTSRIAIEQAKGVLAERHQIDMQRAFDALRYAARATRVRIHELAESVITSRVTPPEVELALAQASPVDGG